VHGPVLAAKSPKVLYAIATDPKPAAAVRQTRLAIPTAAQRRFRRNVHKNSVSD
jgi:hypothetical protein